MLSRVVRCFDWRFVVPLGVIGIVACGGPTSTSGVASPGSSPGSTPAPGAPGTPGTPGAPVGSSGTPGSGGGVVSVASAALVASASTAASNGATVTLTVTVLDAAGNPAPNVPVTFSGPGVTVFGGGAAITNASGVATATIASLVPGPKTISASVNGTALASVNVTFTGTAGCSDGTTFPSSGYVIGTPFVPIAGNWSPNVFTNTAGSIFIPDDSVFEHNDPAQPLTGGGHNWVFDQGSTLCKETDVGPAGGVATGWSIPPNTPTDCVLLPIIKGGRVQNLGDIPYQGDVLTPTCDPTLLSQAGAPNPNNTALNQLGCSISHGVATTPQTATSYLFVAGIKGGLFSIALDNVVNPVRGGTAGKTVGPQSYYSDIPEGSLLTNAIVSKDGLFAMATSIRRSTVIYACLHPLGDPGDPGQPINPNFFVPPAGTVKCMQVGSNNLAVDLTDAFGPDGQPYFGGQRVVNSFDSVPGNSALNPVASAWPDCTWRNNGATSLADAFNRHLANGCGNAQPNFGFTSALVTQPTAMITHGDYMYTGPLGGTLVQFKVTKDPVSGLSQYKFRTYVTGLSLTTGLGIADDLKSLMVFTDPTAVGLAGQEIVTKLPICEDM